MQVSISNFAKITAQITHQITPAPPPQKKKITPQITFPKSTKDVKYSCAN
jgi:hypothetical protein